MSTSEGPTSRIAGFFRFAERGTTLRTEVLAGLTTFVVMAYIIFVNPSILSTGALETQGPPFAGVLTATCLAAGFLSITMGLVTNYPFALASGMGLNAVVAYDLILTRGLPWEAAMGVIFLEGAVITLLVLTGLRESVMNAIPLDLKRAISVGIGLFILFIGLNNAGFVRAGEGTPMQLGDLTTFAVLLSVFGLLATLFLVARGVRAALLVGILATTVIGVIAHYLFGADVTAAVPGVQGALPSDWVRPDVSTLGRGVNAQVFSLLGPLTAVLVVFSIMLSDFFDTMGTIIGVGEQAGFVDDSGRLPGTRRVLLVDSLGAVLGGASGASSVTTYIESAAGVAQGGRTGLTAVVVGVLFLLSVALAPLAGIVPSEATAPALIIVGFLMCAVLRDIDFRNLETGLPALLTMTMMPFTYTITNGIGAGFVTYVFVKAVRGHGREVHPLMWGIAAAFVVYFLMPFLEARLAG